MELINTTEYDKIPAFENIVMSMKDLNPDRTKSFIFLAIVAHKNKAVGFLSVEMNSTNLVYTPNRDAVINYKIPRQHTGYYKTKEFNTTLLLLQRKLHATIAMMEENVLMLSDDMTSFQIMTTKVAGKSNEGKATDKAIHLLGYTPEKMRIVMFPDLSFKIYEESEYKKIRAKNLLADHNVYKSDSSERSKSCAEYDEEMEDRK